MAYLIFIAATSIVALSLGQLEAERRVPGSASGQGLLLAGLAAHLAGTGGIAWLDGAFPGLLAFVAIPATASALHSLLIAPAHRARRLRTQDPGPGYGRAPPRPSRGDARQRAPTGRAGRTPARRSGTPRPREPLDTAG
jgi:hypothetical protein